MLLDDDSTGQDIAMENAMQFASLGCDVRIGRVRDGYPLDTAPGCPDPGDLYRDRGFVGVQAALGRALSRSPLRHFVETQKERMEELDADDRRSVVDRIRFQRAAVQGAAQAALSHRHPPNEAEVIEAASFFGIPTEAILLEIDSRTPREKGITP